MARLFSSPKPRADLRATLPTTAPPPTVPLPPPPTPLRVDLPGPDPAAPSPDQDPALAAERNLLRRAGGRAGTVLTSWRGLLAPGIFAPRRRSLLGE